MSNSHREKFFANLLLGLFFLIAGVLLIVFATFERREEDWYLWGLLSAILISIAMLFLGAAFVHRVKSDLIRRQKSREHSKKEAA